VIETKLHPICGQVFNKNVFGGFYFSTILNDL